MHPWYCLGVAQTNFYYKFEIPLSRYNKLVNMCRIYSHIHTAAWRTVEGGLPYYVPTCYSDHMGGVCTHPHTYTQLCAWIRLKINKHGMCSTHMHQLRLNLSLNCTKTAQIYNCSCIASYIYNFVHAHLSNETHFIALLQYLICYMNYAYHGNNYACYKQGWI